MHHQNIRVAHNGFYFLLFFFLNVETQPFVATLVLVCPILQ